MKLINFIKNNIYVMLVLTGVLIPFTTWFKHGYLIGEGDVLPYLNPIKDIHLVLYLWDIHNGGMSSYKVSDIIIWIYGFFSFFNIPIEIIQKIHLTLWFLLPGLSMYYLSSAFFTKDQIWAKFFASFFYMYNMFIVFTTLNSIAGWALIIIPFLLGLYIKGLKTPQSFKKYVILFSIFTISSSYLANNPPTLAILLIILFSYFIYHLISSNSSERYYCLKFTFYSLFLSMVLNLWWLYPFYNLISGFGTSGELSAKISIEAWGWTMARNSILNIFKLNTIWAWSKTYYPFVEAYSNPLVSISTMVPTILAFSSILFYNKKNKRMQHTVLFFSLYSILLIFISKGIHPPFKSFYIMLYNNVPFFWLFREPAGKFFFILILCYAILIGFTIENILQKINNFKNIYLKIVLLLKISLVVIIISTILISAFPIITGELIPEKRSGLPSEYIKIPDYYYSSSVYVNNAPDDFKILVLPPNDFYQMPYNWGYYGIDISSFLFNKPVLKIAPEEGYVGNYFLKLSNITYHDGITNQSKYYFWKMAGIMNVKFILNREDIDYTFRSSILPPNNVKMLLDNSNNVHFNKRIGKLSFYQIDKTYFIPHIYTAPTQIVVFSLHDVLSAIKSKEFQPDKQIIIVSSQNKNKTKLQIHSSTHPYLFFQKINPIKYKIKIEYAHEPFWLVFSESFHPGWQAYINTDKIQCNPIVTYSNVNVTECLHKSKFFEFRDFIRIFNKPVPEKYHFVVNGYANGWYIDPQELGTGENFTITLYYNPQSYFYVGVIISGLAFLGCIGYLFQNWRKTKIKRSLIYYKGEC